MSRDLFLTPPGVSTTPPEIVPSVLGAEAAVEGHHCMNNQGTLPTIFFGFLRIGFLPIIFSKVGHDLTLLPTPSNNHQPPADLQ